MAHWLTGLLSRVRTLAAARDVRFTTKAIDDLSALGMDREDAFEILMTLTAADSAGRLRSTAGDDWMYVFKPLIAGVQLYIKLVIRAGCLVVSFHEDREDRDDEPT